MVCGHNRGLVENRHGPYDLELLCSPKVILMSHPPSALRAIREQRVFELDWADGPMTRVAFRDLRLLCPCAACVDEFTGERIVNPAMVPTDVAPTGMRYSGLYALKISWSDGHDTGLYSWEYLAKLPVESLVELRTK